MLGYPREAIRVRAAFTVAITVVAATPAAAQRSEADGAWGRGEHSVARAAYEQVLAQDPADVRANLRLGLLLSWEGRLDSALVHIRRARIVDPADVDARLIEARVLAWSGRFDAAVALYDSLLAEDGGRQPAALGRAETLAWADRLGLAGEAYRAMLERNPTDTEARVGLARTYGWRGDLRAAEGAYLDALANDPARLDAMVGLGYVYHWQARQGRALRQVERALAIEPAHAGARRLRAAIRTATRASVESSVNWSNDSDRNTNFWQSISVSVPLAEGLRGFGAAGSLQAGDPSRQANRLSSEFGISWAVGRVQLTGALGARRLLPDSAEARTGASYRATVSYRPISALGLGVGYARHPFDETAALIERGLDLESLDAGVEATLMPGLTLHGGVGAGWINDGNHRTSILAGLTQRVRRGLTLGFLGRTLGYDRRGAGYFSPDRFGVLEIRSGYQLDWGLWEGNVSGGLGAQRVGRAASAQTEWHLDARLARRWGDGNRAELFGLATNSAVSSTTGAFRYRSLGISLRIGL